MGILTFHFNYYLDREPLKGKYIIVKLDGADCTTNTPVVKESVTNKPQVLVATRDETGISSVLPCYTKAAEFVGTDRSYLSLILSLLFSIKEILT